MGRLEEDLRAEGRERVETHISWVFLGENDVWKVKKPVDFGFLDFSDVESRRRFCEAEVELNRRLAPDAYYGVVPVTRGPDGVHRVCGEGEVVDWAVHMRRLSDADRADHLLEGGGLGLEHVARLAEHLAAFHAEARCDAATSRFGSVQTIEANVRENFSQTRESLSEHVSLREAEELERTHLGFLARERDLFAARVEEGRVRDGHGDLRLEHVYFEGPGKITVLDCIEFNERFRYADVCADLAFLSMDLVYRERVDLAEHLLARYARASNDYDLYALVDFYMSYRAFVRGKVASFLAADGDQPTPVRERAAHEARRYFQCALALERPPIVPPVVVAVGGGIACGKSTVAEALGARMGAPVVDSDRTRKFLAGAEPTERVGSEPFSGAYSEAATAAVYAELVRRAGRVVASGRPVVLDATFRTRAQRTAARELARTHGVPFHFVECVVDDATCRERLRARESGAHVSDGRLDLLADFRARWEPVDEIEPGAHRTLDTAGPLEASMQRLGQWLGLGEREVGGGPDAT